jgi:DNA-binding NarL/FixJ family response regulator
MTIRVIIADDHPLIRDGLRGSLARDDDIEVLGEASDGKDALELIEKLRGDLDIALFDTKMPEMGGLDAAIEVGRRFPRIAVIMLSAHAEPDIVRRAMENGVRGYLLKYQQGSGLVDAVRTVAAGGMVVDPQLSPAIAKAVNQPAVTERDVEVLTLLAKGLSNVEIGKQLYVAPDTVKGYLDQIYRKLGANDRTSAVAEALRRGIID